MDFDLNIVYLSAKDHRGDKSPHKCRETDLYYKCKLEQELRDILVGREYTVQEVIDLLGLKPKQANRAFKKVRNTGNGMSREGIIFRLMGGRYYL